MMRSLFSAVSGLKNNQTAMDVIGNNISNVNTTGFKASRTLFQDIFSQTLVSATAPTQTTGGRNPQQVGLGTTIAAISMDMTEGSTQSTANPLDFAISGEGFFVVDKDGVIAKFAAQAAEDAGGAGDEEDTVTTLTPDMFVYTRAGALTLDADGYLVTQNGHRLVGVLQGFVQEEVDGNTTYVSVLDKTPETMTLSYIKMSGEVEVYELDENGNPVMDGDNFVTKTVSVSNYKIDENGYITAMDANGKTYTLGRLILGTFSNSAGVEKIGSSYYRQSQNSGTADLAFAGEGRGILKSGALEMSNVDLATELTNMIITQRAYQANSRVITTSDTLLEELINLKR